MSEVIEQDLEKSLEIEETFRLGWATFTSNLVPLVIGSMIASFVTVISLGLLHGPVWVGLTRMCLNAARGLPVSASEVFSGFSSFPSTFVFGILFMVVAGICLGLGVLPGLGVLYLFFWAPELIADGESSGPVDCLKRSFELTTANVGPQLVFVLVNYVLGYSGMMVFLGFFLTWPLAGCVSVHGYLRAHARQASAQQGDLQASGSA